jgi:hypothetical protein
VILTLSVCSILSLSCPQDKDKILQTESVNITHYVLETKTKYYKQRVLISPFVVFYLCLEDIVGDINTLCL